MRDKLAALDADAMATAHINMNSLSDAPSVQLILEQHLEKKSGARLLPASSTRASEQVKGKMRLALVCNQASRRQQGMVLRACDKYLSIVVEHVCCC